MNATLETLKYICTWFEVTLYKIFADDGRRSIEYYKIDKTTDV